MANLLVQAKKILVQAKKISYKDHMLIKIIYQISILIMIISIIL